MYGQVGPVLLFHCISQHMQAFCISWVLLRDDVCREKVVQRSKAIFLRIPISICNGRQLNWSIHRGTWDRVCLRDTIRLPGKSTRQRTGRTKGRLRLWGGRAGLRLALNSVVRPLGQCMAVVLRVILRLGAN